MEGAGEAPEGSSSGWATMHGTLRIPYLLDTEATSSKIPETMLSQLTTLVPTTQPETLDQPIQIVQADGSKYLVNRVVRVGTMLETEAGP